MHIITNTYKNDNFQKYRFTIDNHFFTLCRRRTFYTLRRINGDVRCKQSRHAKSINPLLLFTNSIIKNDYIHTGGIQRVQGRYIECKDKQNIR